MRSVTSSLLSLQTSSLWLISLITSWMFMKHSPVLKAFDCLTNLASDVTILRATSKHASPFQCWFKIYCWPMPQLQLVFYLHMTDPSGGVKRSTMQLIKHILFSVFCMHLQLSRRVNILAGLFTFEITVSELDEGPSTSENLESTCGWNFVDEVQELWRELHNELHSCETQKCAALAQSRSHIKMHTDMAGL